MKERRVGRFILSQELLQDFPDSVRLLWSGLIPLRVEHRFDTDCFDCVAEGEVFESVKRGTATPRYEINTEIIKNDKDETIGALLSFVSVKGERKAA